MESFKSEESLADPPSVSHGPTGCPAADGLAAAGASFNASTLHFVWVRDDQCPQVHEGMDEGVGGAPMPRILKLALKMEHLRGVDFGGWGLLPATRTYCRCRERVEIPSP